MQYRLRCQMQDRIRNFWVSDFDKLTVQPVNSEQNDFPKFKFNIIQLRRVFVLAFSQSLLGNFFRAAHILQETLTGTDPRFEIRQNPSEWLHANLTLFN